MKMKVMIEGQEYLVSIEDILARPMQVDVDGEVFEVWPEEAQFTPMPQTPRMNATSDPISSPTPTSVAAMPSASGSTSSALQNQQVKAPIPGVIVDVMVSTGDAVTYGQELCVLEAMKMKNSIRAGREGVIEKILITSGQQVNQNQVLMTYRAEGK